MDAGRLTRGRPVATRGFLELLFGGERTHFLGVSRPLAALGWVVLVAGLALLCWGLARAWRGGVSLVGMAFRLVGAFIGAAGLWLLTHTLLSHGGRPGTVVVTLVYVAVGIGAVPPRARAGAPADPGTSRAALLSGRVPAPDDDHARGRRLHVPDAHRHQQRAIGATVG